MFWEGVQLETEDPGPYATAFLALWNVRLEPLWLRPLVDEVGHHGMLLSIRSWLSAISIL
jgi:hypothetical protein